MPVDVAITLIVNHVKSLVSISYFALNFLIVSLYSTISIEKFTGENSFGLWQIKMKGLLKQQQIWRPLASKIFTAGSEDGLTDG